jgi:DNA replication protein DnaC
MDNALVEKVEYIGLDWLKENGDTILKDAQKKSPSYQMFLTSVITAEYEHKLERRRVGRLSRARIPEILTMETFPFSRQPTLQKRKVLGVYDSLQYLNESKVLLFAGPTGCGKSGLATSFLVHAINNGFNGLFIDFNELISKLYQSCADNSHNRLIKQLTTIDCLLIDEFGYTPVNEQKASLFFDLMKARHRKKCTIITSQLGFDVWNNVIRNEHITAAIIDRITENCAVFNMTKCVSLREKKIMYATDQRTTPHHDDKQ